jgi:AAA family ATP:ADP antiporter
MTASSIHVVRYTPNSMAAGRPRLPSVKAAIARVLGIRPGEVGRGILLFSYLFLVVGSFIAAKSSRDAMFLTRFSAIQLPFVDLPVALLVSVWVSGYIRIGRYVSLRTMLQGSLLLFGVTSVAFWYVSLHSHGSWILPVVYIWIGMFGVVAPAQVWTLANYVLTTREAKRLFGFIGSGATLGATLGGLFVQQTVMVLGAESTLLTMAVALLLSALIVELLWRRRHLAQVTDYEESEPATARGGPTGLRASLKLIASSPYLIAIAAVICLSSCTTAVVGWQFKAMTSHVKHESQQMAAFFGAFTFWAGTASLLMQWLVTSRVLRRLGLAFALFVVPVSLTLGSFGYLAFGTLAAVVTLRGLDQVLRYSIDRPTVELLYLPLPPEHTFQVKSFIDTVVWRFGDALAALTIILFGFALSWTPRQVTWVNVTLLCGWIAAAWVAQRLYVANLEESIHNHRLNTEQASAQMLDRAATDLLASRLQSSDVQQVLYALEQFGAAPGAAAHPAVRELLAHPHPEVRRMAVELLDRTGDLSVTPAVERLLYDSELPVRTSALLFVAHHAHIDPLERIEQLGDFEDFSIRSAMVSFLAQPGPTENLEAAGVIFNAMVQDTDVRAREEAARLLLQLPDSFGVGAVEQLLESSDDVVVRLALASVTRLHRRHFIPLVLPKLADASLAEDAAMALASLGDRALPQLRAALDDETVSITVRREIPEVLHRIGTPAAEAELTNCLLDGDTALRFHALIALNKLRGSASKRPLDLALVETALAAELVGHLRSYQMLGTLNFRIDTREPVAQTIRDEMSQEVERIFRLLKLLFPSFDLHSAYVGLQSDNRSVHDNALEFLDNVLKPQLRDLLVPLLDSEVSVVQRAQLADKVLGTSVATREEAVAQLALSPDPWLQACAAYAIGTLGLAELASHLDHWVDAPDVLLRETARQAKIKLRMRGKIRAQQ